MHTLVESKSIFAIEQKTIVSWLVKNVAFLLGHPVLLLCQNHRFPLSNFRGALNGEGALISTILLLEGRSLERGAY